MPLDKSPLVIKEFKGKLVTDVDPIDTTLGEIDQSKVPFEYALDSVNLDYLKKGGMRTRNGIDKYVTIDVVGKPIQMFKIENLLNVAQTDRWLIITRDAGNILRLYDTQVALPATNPIYTSLNANKYVAAINAFGRMYVSFCSDYLAANSVGRVIVYTGAYNARLAKCPRPVVGAFAVAAAAGGYCTVGLHYVSVLFETDTGYISECPTAHLTTPLFVTTTAANATISINNLPVGAAGDGVIRRHIIITKVVINPPALGNAAAGFMGFEPFIAKTINDNTTIATTFDSPDSYLVDSAKTYIENGISIPNCVNFGLFGNRMVYLATARFVAGAPLNRLLVSPPNRPEQVNTAGGFRNIPKLLEDTISTIHVGQDFTGRVAAGYELNSVFYVFKEDSTFAIVEEEDKDPAEWEDPVLIDSGKGAFPFGIAKIGNNPSSNNDGTLLIAGRQGLSYFNGKFAQRSIAESIWDEYRIEDLKWAKIIADPLRQTIFMRIGDFTVDDLLPPHGANRNILIGNYYYGEDLTAIRWGRWEYLVDHTGNPLLTIADIDFREPGTAGNDGGLTNYTSLHSLLCLLYRIDIGAGNWHTKIYSEAIQDRDFLTPLGVAGVFPVWKYDTGYTPNKAGEVYNFGPVKIRVTVHAGGATGGVNTNVSIYKSKLDSSTWTLIGTFSVDDFPGKYYSLNMNETGEHVKLRITGQNRVFIEALVLHTANIAQDRPRV